MPENVDLSFVIPVYNEQDSLVELHAQIAAVMSSLGQSYEILFVNDGSTDQSWTTIRRLTESDANVRAIGFRRNFGKAAALTAGFTKAQGKIIFTLDADLQDDPAEIPHFLAKLKEGYDVVSGWKKIRHDPWHKVLPSRVFNGMVSRKTGVVLHDHNCGFKAYRRDVLSSISLYGERHRFVPVLAAAFGFRVGEVIIHHRARPYGQSKYGLNRFLRGFLDLQSVSFLSRYRNRPMHWYGSRALIFLVFGLFCLLGSIILFFLSPQSFASQFPLIVGCTLILTANLTYLMGLNAEARLDQSPPVRPYSVSDSIRCD